MARQSSACRIHRAPLCPRARSDRAPEILSATCEIDRGELVSEVNRQGEAYARKPHRIADAGQLGRGEVVCELATTWVSALFGKRARAPNTTGPSQAAESRRSARRPITLIKRELKRQDTKDAKVVLRPWRPWCLGGSKFCVFRAVSTRLSLLARRGALRKQGDKKQRRDAPAPGRLAIGGFTRRAPSPEGMCSPRASPCVQLGAHDRSTVPGQAVETQTRSPKPSGPVETQRRRRWYCTRAVQERTQPSAHKDWRTMRRVRGSAKGGT